MIFFFFPAAELTEHFYLAAFYKCRRNKEGMIRFMALQSFRDKLRAGLMVKMLCATFNVFSLQKLTLCSGALHQKVTHLFTGENISLPHAQAICVHTFHTTHTQLRPRCASAAHNAVQLLHLTRLTCSLEEASTGAEVSTHLYLFQKVCPIY